MILSGLTMNLILYEKDYGLAIATLALSFQPSHERNEVIALNSNKKTFPKVIEELGKLFSLELFISPYSVIEVRCLQ